MKNTHGEYYLELDSPNFGRQLAMPKKPKFLNWTQTHVFSVNWNSCVSYFDFLSVKPALSHGTLQPALRTENNSLKYPDTYFPFSAFFRFSTNTCYLRMDPCSLQPHVVGFLSSTLAFPQSIPYMTCLKLLTTIFKTKWHVHWSLPAPTVDTTELLVLTDSAHR